MLRREMNDEEKQLRKENGKKVKDIQNQDMCPSCYNMKNGGLYTENKNRMLYEDSLIQCFLEEYPRTPGHTIILIKQHYEDISEMPLFIGTQVIETSRAVIHAMKEILGAKKVYMCTMCDGGRNHLHFQLIPRYEGDITGSKLFVKERGIYVDDARVVVDLRKSIKLFLDPNTDFTEPSEEFYRYNDEQNRRVISEILKREEKYVAIEPEEKIEEPKTIEKVEETKVEELEKAAERTESEAKEEYLKSLEMSNKGEIEEITEIEKKQEEKPDVISEEKEVVESENVNEDPLLQEAIDYVIKNRIPSPNAIQKKLGIGYFRAVKLIEEMEKKGIVSPYNKTTHKRDVLVKNEEVSTSVEQKNIVEIPAIEEKEEVKLEVVPPAEEVQSDFCLDIENITEKIQEKIEEIDPIFEEVIDYCIEVKRFEFAELQTEFTIGYTRALSIFATLKYLDIIKEKEVYGKNVYETQINENQAFTIQEILKEKREEKALEYAEEEPKTSVENINYFSSKHYVDSEEIEEIKEIKEEKIVEEVIEEPAQEPEVISDTSYLNDLRKRDPKEIVNKIFAEYRQSQETPKETEIIEESEKMDNIVDNDIAELFKMKKEAEETVVEELNGAIKFEVTDDRKTEIITVEDAIEKAKKEDDEKEEIEDTIKKEISLREKKEKIRQILGNAFSKKEKDEVEEAEIEEKEEIDPYDMSTEQYLKNELNKIKEDTLQEEEINKIEENVSKNFDMITSKIAESSENDLSAKMEIISKYLDEDSLLKEAIQEAIDSNNASATFMQRKLRITYTRAIRLLDMMQEAGVINKFTPGEPRRVLLTYREWLEIKKSLEIL